jgi:hypothetical protein
VAALNLLRDLAARWEFDLDDAPAQEAGAPAGGQHEA